MGFADLWLHSNFLRGSRIDPQHVAVHPVEQRLILCPSPRRVAKPGSVVAASREAQHLDCTAVGPEHCVELLRLFGQAAIEAGMEEGGLRYAIGFAATHSCSMVILPCMQLSIRS